MFRSFCHALHCKEAGEGHAVNNTLAIQSYVHLPIEILQLNNWHSGTWKCQDGPIFACSQHTYIPYVHQQADTYACYTLQTQHSPIHNTTSCVSKHILLLHVDVYIMSTDVQTNTHICTHCSRYTKCTPAGTFPNVQAHFAYMYFLPLLPVQ